MRERIDLAKSEIRFLEELERNAVPFMVVGLGAAALQGAPMVTEDIDLWFKDLRHPGIRAALTSVGGSLVVPYDLGFQQPPMFSGAALRRFDIVLTVHGVASFTAEHRKANRLKIGECLVHVMPLERIIRSKKAANRPKDRAALPALEDTLNVLRVSRLSEEHRRRRKG